MGLIERQIRKSITKSFVGDFEFTASLPTALRQIEGLPYSIPDSARLPLLVVPLLRQLDLSKLSSNTAQSGNHALTFSSASNLVARFSNKTGRLELGTYTDDLRRVIDWALKLDSSGGSTSVTLADYRTLDGSLMNKGTAKRLREILGGPTAAPKAVPGILDPDAWTAHLNLGTHTTHLPSTHLPPIEALAPAAMTLRVSEAQARSAVQALRELEVPVHTVGPEYCFTVGPPHGGEAVLRIGPGHISLDLPNTTADLQRARSCRALTYPLVALENDAKRRGDTELFERLRALAWTLRGSTNTLGPLITDTVRGGGLHVPSTVPAPIGVAFATTSTNRNPMVRATVSAASRQCSSTSGIRKSTKSEQRQWAGEFVVTWGQGGIYSSVYVAEPAPPGAVSTPASHLVNWSMQDHSYQLPDGRNFVIVVPAQLSLSRNTIDEGPELLAFLASLQATISRQDRSAEVFTLIG